MLKILSAIKFCTLRILLLKKIASLRLIKIVIILKQFLSPLQSLPERSYHGKSLIMFPDNP